MPTPGVAPANTPSSLPRHQRQLSIGSLPTTPAEYLSPSTRRHAGVLSPAVQLSLGHNENNDAAEKRERRRSRICDLAAGAVAHSPRSLSDGRRVSPLNGLSTSQLTDHYSNCIKLSTENKINSKNAFGLHLIDYMSDLMRKKEMTNFQVASSTLDASTKIYAGRVDAIHSETYRVLSSLGVGANEKDDEDQGGDEETGDGKEEGTRKEKRVRRGITIETNTKKLDIRKVDLDFQVDPFFQKMSAAFDEGGSDGLLLSHLYCYGPGCELSLDSNTVLVGGGKDGENGGLVNAKDFMEMYQSSSIDTLQICPAFADFEFMKCDEDSQMSLSSRQANHDATGPVDGVFAFDLSAQAEPCHEDGGGASDMSAIADDFGHMAVDEDDDDSNGPVETACCEAQTLDPVESMITSMSICTVNSLVQSLSTRPSEYSYFKQNVASQWSGPGHWKLRPHSALAAAERKSRTKKAPFLIDYTADDCAAHARALKSGRAATTLTRTTLVRYGRALTTTLPEQLRYDTECLLRTFLKPTLMVTRAVDGSTNVCGDDGVEGYDYNNAQDRDNFCPPADAFDDDDDQVERNSSAAYMNAFDMSDDVAQISQSFTSATGGAAADGSVLASDNLVAQPTRVAKMNIVYAKVAKRYDMKLLKSTMWKLLSKPHEENKENENEADQVSTTSSTTAAILDEQLSRVYGEHQFSTLIQDLDTSLPKSGSNHKPSVHIAFACLLHLANEKNLTLRSAENLQDISILQC